MGDAPRAPISFVLALPAGEAAGDGAAANDTSNQVKHYFLPLIGN
jgi:hypothetical protein